MRMEESLIYVMGSEAEKIFSSFEYEDETQKENYDVVLRKFNDYHNAKKKPDSQVGMLL